MNENYRDITQSAVTRISHDSFKDENGAVDHAAINSVIERGHFRPTINGDVLWPQEAVNAYWNSVYKGKPT